MSQKSSVPQAVSFVSQVLKRDNSEPIRAGSCLGFLPIPTKVDLRMTFVRRLCQPLR